MLIGEDGRWQVSLEGGISTPDAVWVDVIAGIILRAILILKNIDGVGRNALLQSTLLYSKTLTARGSFFARLHEVLGLFFCTRVI